MTVLTSIALFALAAVAEICGAWLIWQGVREKRGLLLIGAGVIGLGLYGFVATLQPTPTSDESSPPTGSVRRRQPRLGRHHRRVPTRPLRHHRRRNLPHRRRHHHVRTEDDRLTPRPTSSNYEVLAQGSGRFSLVLNGAHYLGFRGIGVTAGAYG
jgi:Uncharacterised BCR, YnfA/UPF0060 family